MLTYKAMFKFVEDEVHAATLEEARRLLSSAFNDMAEIALSGGEALPLPNPQLTDKDADLEEPIYLLFSAASVVKPVAVQHEAA